METNMARFGTDEFVGHVPAFIAFIREINGEHPGTFLEPRIEVDGVYTIENYPTARVILRNDRNTNVEAADEGIRVIADDPTLIPAWQRVSAKIYAESVVKRKCANCSNRVEPGEGKLCPSCTEMANAGF